MTELEIVILNKALTGNIEERTFIFSKILPDYFVDIKFRSIFYQIKEMFDSSGEVDINVLSNKIFSFNETLFENIEQVLILLEVIKNSDKETSLKIVADSLEEQWKRNKIIDRATILINKARDKKSSLSELNSDYIDLSLFTGKQDYIISGEDILTKRVSELNSRRISPNTVYSGFQNLDDNLSKGFARGEISIIAGRPGMGKSLLKDVLITNMACSGKGIISACLEQSFQDEMDRITSNLTKINLDEFYQIHEWKKDDKVKRIMEVTKRIAKDFNIHFIDKRIIDANKLIGDIRAIKNNNEIDIVFIDLFDRIREIQSEIKNQQNQINNILGMFSEWAKILDVHFCLINQINRDLTKRSEKRPTMADLKGSGAYEEKANLILLLHRPGYYSPDETAMNDTLEVYCPKQKQGRSEWGVKFQWKPETMSLIPQDFCENI